MSEPSRTNVAVTRITDLAAPSDALTSDAIRAAAKQCEVTIGYVHVVYCDDDEIAGVHGEFFDDPTPTDVITFPLDGDGSPESPVSGELLISVETAARVAAEQGHDTDVESVLYAIHGVLHLGGFDDQTAPKRAEMRAAERVALQTLGQTVQTFH